MKKISKKIKMPDNNSYEWWLEGYRTGQIEAYEKSISMLGNKDPNIGHIPIDLKDGILYLKLYLSKLRKTMVKYGLKSKNRINYFHIIVEEQNSRNK